MSKQAGFIYKILIRLGLAVGAYFLLSLVKAPAANAANCVTPASDQYTNAIVYVRLQDNVGNYLGTVPYQMLASGYDPYVGKRSSAYNPNGIDSTILDISVGFLGVSTTPYRSQTFNVSPSSRTGVNCDNLPDLLGDGTNARGAAMPFDFFPNQFQGLSPQEWALNSRPNGDPYSYGYTFKLQGLTGYPTYTNLGYTIYVPDGTFPAQPGPLRLRYNAGDPGVVADTANLNPATFDALLSIWGTPPAAGSSADLTRKTFYVYFDIRLGASPPPSIDLSVINNTRGTSGGSINAYIGDELALDWNTTSATSCTATNNFGGSWVGPKTPNPPTAEVRPTPPNTDTSVVRTITYTLTCVNSSGVSRNQTVSVNVQQLKYYPFLQVFNGDVGALGLIHGQRIGQPGGREFTANPYNNTDQNIAEAREGEYLVMASGNQPVSGNALHDADVPTDTALNFCSSSVNRSVNTGSPVFESYNLGQDGTDSGIETNGCHTSAYVLNLAAEYLLPPAGSNDLVLYNLQKGIAANNNPGPECTPTKPYHINPTIYTGALTAATFVTLNGGPPRVNCGGITRFNGNTISSFAPAYGRGTILVNPPGGTLNITGDIKYNFGLAAAGGFGFPAYRNDNDVPNLGIVVNGDVKISGNVGYIDAAIYATGSIDTCVEGPGNGVCKSGASKPLQVRGALLAKKGFKFNRGFYNIVNNPGEVIYATGSWLNSPPPGLEDRYSQYSTKVTYLGEQFPVFNTKNTPSISEPIK